ncbi:hypothetical protein [Achromobacter phage nyashin_LB6]|nr:hypothetical protein [Achromobacter phage nyashin_LB6]
MGGVGVAGVGSQPSLTHEAKFLTPHTTHTTHTTLYESPIQHPLQHHTTIDIFIDLSI